MKIDTSYSADNTMHQSVSTVYHVIIKFNLQANRSWSIYSGWENGKLSKILHEFPDIDYKSISTNIKCATP